MQNHAYVAINHPDDDALNQQRPLLQGDHDDETLEAPYVRSSALILVAFCFESLTSIITVVWFWRSVCEFRDLRQASGEFAARRRQQALTWMWDLVHARLVADFRESAAVREALPRALADVEGARVAPSVAARRLLDLFEQRRH